MRLNHLKWCTSVPEPPTPSAQRARITAIFHRIYGSKPTQSVKAALQHLAARYRAISAEIDAAYDRSYRDGMSGIRGRRRSALRGGCLVLLMAAVLVGCGGSGMGLLYKDKEVSFSNIEAIKNGCPRRVYVAFADDGPRVLSSMSMESERPREKEDAPPILEWQPPCSFWQGEFGFDGVPVASVPKGAAEPDGAGCRDAARASLIDGTSIGRYSTRYLAVGERFCEGFESADGSRVILLRVVKVSGSPVVEEITLAATMWAGPAAEEKAEATGGLPQPGDKVYENVPFRLVESIAKANDCGVGTVGLGGSRPGISFHNGPGLMLSGTGDIGYFPGCLNGNPKLRFGAYVGRVQGGADPDLAACQDIAARGSRESLDVLVSDLRLGDRFCIFNSGEDFVALVKVTELSATDPVSVTFSATRWEAPGPS